MKTSAAQLGDSAADLRPTANSTDPVEMDFAPQVDDELEIVEGSTKRELGILLRNGRNIAYKFQSQHDAELFRWACTVPPGALHA